MMRAFLTLLFGAALSTAALSTAALALSPGEAGKIVALLEQLSPELGEIAYDGEEADRWFEDDAGYEQRIAKAGFTQESWKTGFDAVVKGYFALIPQAEIDAMLNSARVRLAQSSHLTAEQKTEVVASFDEHVSSIQRYREEGRASADAVRPFAARIRKLMGSGN